MVIVPCAYCGKKLRRISARAKGRCYCNSTHQLKYQYENGIVDHKTVADAAHKTLRERGHYKRDNSYLRGPNAPSKQPSARAKIRAAKLKSNWMAGRTGKLHHNWKGGKIWYRGKEWDDTRKRVLKRDRRRCMKCGRTNVENIMLFGAPLQVDHIVPYRETKDNRMENLQTLCNQCHGKKSGHGR